MALKTYNQNCGLAAALDVVGERWTLLIIRTLLSGPARFGEIQSRLPGIGTNLLSARLKQLARRGVIEKQPGPQGEYALTDLGEHLRPMLLQLAKWGRGWLPVAGAAHDPLWTMFNFEAAFVPARAEGLDAVVEFTLAGQKFHLVIRRQKCHAVAGPAVAPDVSIYSERDQALGVGARMQIHGDASIFDRVRPCFDL
jgi:DNA-binding HxlR family transcriptional regulator